MTRIVLKKPELLAALRLATEITKAKSTNPITQAITLETDGRTLFLRACDLESHLGACLLGTNRSDGEIPVQSVVNARAFTQILNSLDSKLVTLHCEVSGKVIVEDDQGRDVVLTSEMKYADFPLWKGMQCRAGASLKLVDLVTALDQASIAMAKESNRFAINGVLLKLDKDGILCVATDGHRMAKATAPGKVKKQGEIVLPATAIRILSQIKADKEAEVEIRIEPGEPNRACFSWDSTELLVRGEAKQFPSYEKVIPANPQNCAQVKKRDLAKAVCRAYSGKAHKAPMARLNFDGQELSVVAVVNEAGSELPTKLSVTYTGAPLGFTMNANYMNDFLAAVPSDELEVKIDTPDRPIMMAGINPPGRFSYVCMPLKA